MIALSYTDPQGEPLSNPSLPLLQKVMLSTGGDYWGNSGDACIGWVKYLNPGYSDVHDRPRLIFFLNELYGFHFAYDAPQQKRLVTYNGYGMEPQVMHYVCGEPFYLPQACFVTRKAAWQIVQDFLKLQQPSPIASWIEAFKINL